MPRLIYNLGQADEIIFQLKEEAVTIGRAYEQSICIPHQSLSRQHARIESSNGQFFIIDMESKNGTLVNGMPVGWQELRSGDNIQLGDLLFLFVDELPLASDGAHTGPLQAPELEPRPQAIRELTRIPLEKLVHLPKQGNAIGSYSNKAVARLHDQVRILLEVAKLLSVTVELDTLLGKILDMVFQLISVDRGAILLLNQEGERLETRVSRIARGLPEQHPIYSQNIVDYVLKHSVAVLFSDAVSDPRLDEAHSVIFQSIRASMCVPLKPKDNVIGVLYVDSLSAPNRFSEEDLEFLVAFASHAAIAIENAALYRRIERETVERMQLIMDAKLASLGSMVGGIAHELRNPLNFINNFASLASERVTELSALLRRQWASLGPGTVTEFEEALSDLWEATSKISAHSHRAEAIIHGMLLHSHRPNGTRDAGDLNELVSESVRLGCGGLRNLLLSVQMEEDYDPAIGAVDMVKADLERVFINVVDNALYAMKQKQRNLGAAYKPVLRVRTANLGEFAEVRIRDNGPGVPADIVPRIFEPFFTTKPPGEGTGLGLSLAHEIVVRSHQGMMRMETEPGEQAEFIITLPKRSRTGRSSSSL